MKPGIGASPAEPASGGDSWARAGVALTVAKMMATAIQPSRATVHHAMRRTLASAKLFMGASLGRSSC